MMEADGERRVGFETENIPVNCRVTKMTYGEVIEMRRVTKGNKDDRDNRSDKGDEMTGVIDVTSVTTGDKDVR